MIAIDRSWNSSIHLFPDFRIPPSAVPNCKYLDKASLVDHPKEDPVLSTDDFPNLAAGAPTKDGASERMFFEHVDASQDIVAQPLGGRRVVLRDVREDVSQGFQCGLSPDYLVIHEATIRFTSS